VHGESRWCRERGRERLRRGPREREKKTGREKREVQHLRHERVPPRDQSSSDPVQCSRQSERPRRE